MTLCLPFWPHAITASREVADACSLHSPIENYTPARLSRGMNSHSTAPPHWRGTRTYPIRYPRVKNAQTRTALIASSLRPILTIKRSSTRAEQELLCQWRGSAANSAVLRLGSPRRPGKAPVLVRALHHQGASRAPDIDVVSIMSCARGDPVDLRTYGRNTPGCAPTSSTTARAWRSAKWQVPWACRRRHRIARAHVWAVMGGDRAARRNETFSTSRFALFTGSQVPSNDRMPRHLSQHVGASSLPQAADGYRAMQRRHACPPFHRWDNDDIDDLGIFKSMYCARNATCIRKTLDL